MLGRKKKGLEGNEETIWQKFDVRLEKGGVFGPL